MIIRADDFKDRSMFLGLAEEAQAKGLIGEGPISWDEGDSIVDLETLEIEVSIKACN